MWDDDRINYILTGDQRKKALKKSGASHIKISRGNCLMAQKLSWYIAMALA